MSGVVFALNHASGAGRLETELIRPAAILHTHLHSIVLALVAVVEEQRGLVAQIEYAMIRADAHVVAALVDQPVGRVEHELVGLLEAHVDAQALVGYVHLVGGTHAHLEAKRFTVGSGAVAVSVAICTLRFLLLLLFGHETSQIEQSHPVRAQIVGHVYLDEAQVCERHVHVEYLAGGDALHVGGRRRRRAAHALQGGVDRVGVDAYGHGQAVGDGDRRVYVDLVVGVHGRHHVIRVAHVQRHHAHQMEIRVGFAAQYALFKS